MNRMTQLETEVQNLQESAFRTLESMQTDKKNRMGGDVYDANGVQLAGLHDLIKDLNESTKELERARNYERDYKRTNEADANRAERKFEQGAFGNVPDTRSLSEQFLQASNYAKQVNKKQVSAVLASLDLKTLMTNSSGFAPANNRSNVVVFSPQRRLMIADLIPQDLTENAIVKYMEETTFTNSAATVSEGGSIPEAALAYTQQSATVEKIATWLPVTEEQLEDVPSLRGLIDFRLTYMLQLKEEDQILGGNGTAPNLQGFLSKSGVLTQVRGTDSIQDCIYKAISNVRTSGQAEPSAVIMNPADWQLARLSTTTTGEYLFGVTTEEGVERIWGKPVVITPAQTQGTALVGDFAMYSHISRKAGIRIDISDSHSDYFTSGKLAIRAEERLSLEIYRAAAFCKATSLGVS